MNSYRVIVEVNERLYRKLEKAEVILKLKNSDEPITVPVSKRQMKYEVEHYLSAK